MQTAPKTLKKVIYEELKGTPQEIAADMLTNGGSSPVFATYVMHYIPANNMIGEGLEALY